MLLILYKMSDKENEEMPTCKPSKPLIKSFDHMFTDFVKYGLSSFILVLTIAGIFFIKNGMDGSGLVGRIEIFTKYAWVRYLVFGLILCLLGGFVGSFNEQIYNNMVMGIGLFLGISLLKNKPKVLATA